jgi:hypothetical protein
LSREHQAWKALLRAGSSSTALPGELVPQPQSGGIDPRLDRSSSGPVIAVQHAAEALMLRTNLFAQAFRFGDCGGNLTDSSFVYHTQELIGEQWVTVETQF